MAEPFLATTVGQWLQDHPGVNRRDLEVLLCRTAGLTRAQVLARPERPLPASVRARLQSGAERLARGEPVAYITGEREFWGLELCVTPAVLVPRPETELLAEAALTAVITLASEVAEVRVLELGTGTGAVAVALAREARSRGHAVRITATDVSPEALAVAAGNARRHGVELCLAASDWFTAVRGRFHVIVSNPPYVADDDPHLHALRHEPRLALAAGPEGLDALCCIVARAGEHLEPGGTLALEHGHSQGPAVRTLLQRAGFRGIETSTDLAGRERVSQATAAGERTWCKS